MTTIDIQQLHEETERFVLAAREKPISITAQGRIVAVIGPADAANGFDAYWQERERDLASIRLRGSWDSTEAVSADRDRG